MRFTPLLVEGAWLIEPEPRRDERGLFARTRCVNEFAEKGLTATFVQDSVSYNDVAGTLRGLHYQVEPHREVKLVRCTAGSIHDVIVDLRERSPSYLKWVAKVLSAENRHALYVPEGCAHGFVTLEDRSEVFYQISEFHHPESARGVRWNDPAFAIEWPREPAQISERDAEHPLCPRKVRG
ncbi:MAG TPA: dTDP-4-dehydrorhamnose 3,5-epimerase [Polyangiaceae bacterium]|nr:dTDP-4-dehydrorhamnose 3,5-epimerase [Polyangiaceae bacterium]